MGITSHSIDILDEVIIRYRPKEVIELGAQNLYNNPVLPAPYANEYYEPKGISYNCIDLNGENNAVRHDLSTGEIVSKVDLVTDFGTSEHVGREGKHDPEAFYNCWRIKHGLLAVGGIMVSENPKSGNWPGHGFNYVTQAFYKVLCKLQSYELLDLHEHPAMGNDTDGWNVVCVLRKLNNDPFISLEQFKMLDFRTS